VSAVVTRHLRGKQALLVLAGESKLLKDFRKITSEIEIAAADVS
jgi:hypothetical protein